MSQILGYLIPIIICVTITHYVWKYAYDVDTNRLKKLIADKTTLNDRYLKDILELDPEYLSRPLHLEGVGELEVRDETTRSMPIRAELVVYPPPEHVKKRNLPDTGIKLKQITTEED